MSWQEICARCRCSLHDSASRGESGIYDPHGEPIDLCEPCFFDEDAEIERKGGNDLPDTLARYRRNLQLGPDA